MVFLSLLKELCVRSLATKDETGYELYKNTFPDLKQTQIDSFASYPKNNNEPVCSGQKYEEWQVIHVGLTRIFYTNFLSNHFLFEDNNTM